MSDARSRYVRILTLIINAARCPKPLQNVARISIDCGAPTHNNSEFGYFKKWLICCAAHKIPLHVPELVRCDWAVEGRSKLV
jgi:hypothetical protein